MRVPRSALPKLHEGMDSDDNLDDLDIKPLPQPEQGVAEVDTGDNWQESGYRVIGHMDHRSLTA